MPNLKLTRPTALDVPEVARICFEAFAAFHDRHDFPRDVPSLEMANHMAGMLVSRPDFHAVAAWADGRLVGSNFLSCTDPVGGVGPITVDPGFDGRGIGRVLMQDVIGHAGKIGMKQVRLMQDSFNTKSLSLYASLGFNLREACGVMDAKPAPEPDPTIRPATAADLPALDALCQRLYKCSRKGEVAAALAGGLLVLLREKDGCVTGYRIATFFGHGVAETEADALTLVGEMARCVPPELALFFCPLSLGDFYRSALKAGHRLRKVMNYMTLGPYECPSGIWMPSIAY